MTAYSASLIKAKEETEARTVTRDPDDKADSPSYECQSYRDQIDDVRLMRQVHGGTKSMRAEKEKYLPRHPMETVEKYKKRLSIAVAYNALRRTVDGLIGMIFRREPTVSEDMPGAMQDHADNIDLKGNNLPVFLRETGENALLDGHTWIHVESPRTDGVRTDREAEQAGIRPYWINVKKSQAINWRYEMRNGRPVLTLFVYREGAVDPDGEFGEKAVDRIRVLREGERAENGERTNVRGELWELQEDSEGVKRWVLDVQYRVGVTEIPVVALYAEKTAEYESRPPLQDLAYEQIEHYRVRSDRQKSMTFSSIAVPWVFGTDVTDKEGNSKITWGADGMLLLNDPEASAGILESQGHGLEATKEELQEIKENMASLGLQMLVRRTGARPETATSNLLDKSESDASLAAFALAIQDAANECLRIHASYESTIQNPGSVVVNRDFHDQLMEPQMLRVLSDMVGEAVLSLDTMWDILIAGEVLPEDFDPELERERIAQSGVVGLMELFGSGEGGEEEEEMEPAA